MTWEITEGDAWEDLSVDEVLVVVAVNELSVTFQSDDTDGFVMMSLNEFCSDVADGVLVLYDEELSSEDGEGEDDTDDYE